LTKPQTPTSRVCVIVIGDISHVVVNIRLVRKDFRGLFEQTGVQQLFNFVTWLRIMGLPHDHRNATRLTLSHPAQIILVIPLGESGGFAEFAFSHFTRLHRVHDDNYCTSYAKAKND
jgi:hypothetical protein